LSAAPERPAASVASALVVVSLLLPATCVAAAESAASAERGTVFLSARPGRIVVADEATFTRTADIPLATARGGMPVRVFLSDDHARLLALGQNLEDVEVVDIAARKVVGRFTLSEGNTKVRIDGYPGIAAGGRLVALPVRAATKLVDRFEIGPKQVTLYDLDQKKVAGIVPWPNGQERERVGVRYSPDGKLLYLFADDVYVYDTATLKPVDKWELSAPLEDGFGRVRLGAADDTHEERGFVTGLFTVDDPLQHVKMMGVARMDLARKALDFWTIGPALELHRLALAPGRKRAYALLDETGGWEMWTLDLERRQVERRTPFAGRPRMDLKVSSSGRLLYVFGAGNTVDVFDAATHRLLRTVTLDYEASQLFVFPPAP
jgi:hypothetical protein